MPTTAVGELDIAATQASAVAIVVSCGKEAAHAHEIEAGSVTQGFGNAAHGNAACEFVAKHHRRDVDHGFVDEVMFKERADHAWPSFYQGGVDAMIACKNGEGGAEVKAASHGSRRRGDEDDATSAKSFAFIFGDGDAIEVFVEGNCGWCDAGGGDEFRVERD